MIVITVPAARLFPRSRKKSEMKPRTNQSGIPLFKPPERRNVTGRKIPFSPDIRMKEQRSYCWNLFPAQKSMPIKSAPANNAATFFISIPSASV